MQATARRLSVVSATSCARRRLIRDVRPTKQSSPHMAFQFLNADLEITSDRPLDAIRDALLGHEVHFSEMYCGEIGHERYLASFEIDWISKPEEDPTAQQKLDAFCAVLSQFDSPLKQIWDSATKRVIDVGYQSDDLCTPLRETFHAATLAQLAALNIDLVITVYPMTIKNDDGSIVPMKS